MTQKRTIKPEDLYQLKSVADPQLSMNGNDLAFVETRMLEKENTYSSNIFTQILQRAISLFSGLTANTVIIHPAGLQMGS